MKKNITKDTALVILNNIRKKVGNTPLVEIKYIDIPNKCRIFVKEEYKNPTYSHYDRQTVELLYHSVDNDKFIPGQGVLVETTTGSSGASFAWMCRCIGTDCIVFIPEDMPFARKAYIESFGAKLVPTPKDKYVGGLIDTVLAWEAGRLTIDEIGPKSKKHHFMNHSGDREFGPKAMESMLNEIRESFKKYGARLNIYVTALGNGTSVGGIAKKIKEQGTKLVGFEPYNSPSVLKITFPDKYGEIYQGEFPTKNHKIFGTGPGDFDFRRFPNILKVKTELDHIEVVTDEQMAATLEKLHYKEFLLVGNSSAAAVHTALKMAESAKEGSSICTIAYDPAWRYLDAKT